MPEKKTELEQAYADLEKAEQRIKIMQKELREYDRVEQVIVAAGLLDKDKFEQARDLVRSFD